MPLQRSIANQPKKDMYRLDGTLKGPGWLGTLKTNNGRDMTEYSIGVTLDGKQTLIPSLVPTLSLEEIEHLRSGGNVTKPIIDKAVQHAIERIKAGKSPFKEATEDITK